MKRAVLLVAVALVLAVLALRIPFVSGELAIDDPRSDGNRTYPSDLIHPSIVRFVSRLDGLDGQPCFGLVTEAEHGAPREVLNLTALEPSLGSRLSSFVANDGFALADRLFAEPSKRDPRLLERIDEKDLADRVLPTVGVTQEELDRGHALVIGAGPNFAAHREETRVDSDGMVFPKPVEPRGAYSSVAPSRWGHPDAGKLLDYEVEIGFVLLRPIDLGALPSPGELAEGIALFLANDLTDRLPQILYGDEGYTRAKTHPGYLAIGPWMVHGRYLQLGSKGIELHLQVLEHDAYRGGPTRQSASSSELIRGPWAIVRMLSEIHDQSGQLDNRGIEREVARIRGNRAVLPAGTIVLSGTPGGTAIKAPGSWDRIRALVRGNFTMSGARRYFARHSVEHKKEMGYVSAGDIVECWAEHLGRQRWQVAGER